VNVLQAWLSGLIALGALYLVATQGKGLAAAFSGAETFVAGTEKAAIGRG
jgi:hypothetical protein